LAESGLVSLSADTRRAHWRSPPAHATARSPGGITKRRAETPFGCVGTIGRLVESLTNALSRSEPAEYRSYHSTVRCSALKSPVHMVTFAPA